MTEDKTIEQGIICRLHWIIFFRPFLLLIIPLTIAYLGVFQLHILMTFLGISVMWFIMEIVHYCFTWMVVKPKNVILQSGFLVQQTIDLPIKKIESIDTRQSLLGTLFNYGDIIIIGSGGSRQVMNCISEPLTCRRYIEQYLHAAD
jgi:uncharacterized membrane protein YdbT with pleckstrin-like domain